MMAPWLTFFFFFTCICVSHLYRFYSTDKRPSSSPRRCTTRYTDFRMHAGPVPVRQRGLYQSRSEVQRIHRVCRRFRRAGGVRWVCAEAQSSIGRREERISGKNAVTKHECGLVQFDIHIISKKFYWKFAKSGIADRHRFPNLFLFFFLRFHFLCCARRITVARSLCGGSIHVRFGQKVYSALFHLQRNSRMQRQIRRT